MKDSLGLRLAQERRDFTELKKGKTNVDVVLIQDFVVLTNQCCWQFIHSERLEVFLKDIIPWKTFPVFLGFDLDWKTGFHCQKDLFFSFWKTSNWFRKTCCFLFWKTFFIRKTWMLKKDMSFLQKDMNFIFRKTGCCNFFQKDL